MTLAALLVVLMAGTEIFRPLRDMRAVLHQGLMGQSAAASVRALLDATSPAPQGTRNAAPTAAAEGLSISFKDVAFSYPGGRSITHQGRSEEHTSELQSLMRISYAGFC